MTIKKQNNNPLKRIKMMKDNCDICMMYPKVENDSRCAGCKAVQDSWVADAKRLGITLSEYLMRNTRF